MSGKELIEREYHRRAVAAAARKSRLSGNLLVYFNVNALFGHFAVVKKSERRLDRDIAFVVGHSLVAAKDRYLAAVVIGHGDGVIQADRLHYS